LAVLMIALALIPKYSDPKSIQPMIERLGLSHESVNRIIFGILHISWVFILSLPQAILPWTEPDMETDFPQGWRQPC